MYRDKHVLGFWYTSYSSYSPFNRCNFLSTLIGRMLLASLCLAILLGIFGLPLSTTHAANAVNLQQRPENTPITLVDGRYVQPFHGSLGGKWLLFHHGEYLVLKGQGYFLVRWEVAYFNRVVGQLVMPTWTDQTGTLLHVASGGGHRMDDHITNDTPGKTWMGRPGRGFDTLPPGTPMIWQNEFYYLNGTVTLHENEDHVDYNLGITPKMWTDVSKDINHAPQTGTSWIRYGVSYDLPAKPTTNNTNPSETPQHSTQGAPTQHSTEGTPTQHSTEGTPTTTISIHNEQWFWKFLDLFTNFFANSKTSK